jgi:hypothetical protein
MQTPKQRAELDKVQREYARDYLGEPLCATCKHAKPGTNLCAAFPGGIPLDIVSGRWDHTKPIEGDGGIVYERKA